MADPSVCGSSGTNARRSTSTCSRSRARRTRCGSSASRARSTFLLSTASTLTSGSATVRQCVGLEVWVGRWVGGRAGGRAVGRAGRPAGERTGGRASGRAVTDPLAAPFPALAAHVLPSLPMSCTRRPCPALGAHVLSSASVRSVQSHPYRRVVHVKDAGGGGASSHGRVGHAPRNVVDRPPRRGPAVRG